ncbi:MAG: oligosaccharide flippase family protein [Chthoniobacterales bacterium]
MEKTLPAISPELNLRPPVNDTVAELKRGAFFNIIAVLASNFRGIFTFLVARMLGPAVLGTYLTAWAMMDLISKIGVFALDTTVTTFIARSEAAGHRARSRVLFRVAVFLAVLQSSVVAALSIAAIRLFGARLGLHPQMVAAFSVMLCALPGVVLYRISTAVSRGMKIMRHDIYSRGMTDWIVTTMAFLVALGLGFKTFAPEYAVIIGSLASGIVALILAASLFRSAPRSHAVISHRREARRLFAYAAPISAYDLFNSAISRVDVIMLACFIDRAPGVTLPVVGIYGTVVEIAIGLRKVNQAFNPIFGPVVAGMTVHGEQERAAAAFSRVTQWMLWILLPLVAVMILAGSLILALYGPAFQQGAPWLGIVAIACATNALVALAETVIMVQRPRLNLLNSSITCVIAFGANVWLISRFGVIGAALGILLPYVVLGFLRYRALRYVFGWRNPWARTGRPFFAALGAAIPAGLCRATINGAAGQLISAAVFLLVFFAAWQYHRASEPPHPAL